MISLYLEGEGPLSEPLSEPLPESTESAEPPDPVKDVLGLSHELISSTLSYHKTLLSADDAVIATINAVDRLVLGELYEVVSNHFNAQFKERNSQLKSKSQKVVEFGSWQF